MTNRRGATAAILGLACGLVLGWWGYPHLVFERVAAPLPFSHALHTGEDVGMECGDCHDHTSGRALAMPSVGQCADCHDEIGGVELAADPEFAASRPWIASLRQPEGVRFGHPQHVELAGLACAECHGEQASSETSSALYHNRISGYQRALWGRHGLGPAERSPGMEMSDCVRCHEQREVVQSCLDCHR